MVKSSNHLASYLFNPNFLSKWLKLPLSTYLSRWCAPCQASFFFALWWIGSPNKQKLEYDLQWPLGSHPQIREIEEVVLKLIPQTNRAHPLVWAPNWSIFLTDRTEWNETLVAISEATAWPEFQAWIPISSHIKINIKFKVYMNWNWHESTSKDKVSKPRKRHWCSRRASQTSN